MKEVIEEIDEILRSYEDWMHEEEGDNCTRARRLLIRISIIHQQAMKDEREKYEIKRTNVSEEINKIARELHFAGYTLLEGQLKRIARDL